MCVWIDIRVLYIYIFTDRHIDRQIALNSHVLFGGSPEEKIKAAAEAVKNQTKARPFGAPKRVMFWSHEIQGSMDTTWIPPGSTHITMEHHHF